MAKRTAKHNAAIAAALKARGVGASDTKLCPRCQQELPRTDFAVRKNGYSESKCLACQRAYDAERRRRHYHNTPQHRERRRLANQHYQFKRKYGITVDDFRAMREAQDGLCAICRRPPDRGRKDLDVDHCHDTGKVRGLLCSSCNRAIGLLGDSVDRLALAQAYLAASQDDLP